LRNIFLSQISEEKLEKLNSGEPIDLYPKWAGWYLRKPFFDTIDYIIPINVMSNIKAPVLIIHGDKDDLMPVEMSIKAYETIRGLNERNELYIVKGGDHVFSKKEHTMEVIRKTIEWLNSLNLNSGQ